MKKNNFLPFVTKPGRYIGREYNIAARKHDGTTLYCGLVFPDLYEIGMSHQGLQILYHILNSRDNIRAERCYCPDIDAEKLLRAKSLPLVSLETERPLSEFDLIGITLPHELCYTNILTVLDRAGIPFFARDRIDSHPIIIGGGACSLNPEPVADFFDAVLLGDGEEAIVEISDQLLAARQQGLSRRDQVERLSDINGIYLPHHYKPVYHDDGHIVEIHHEQATPATVKKRIVATLDDLEHLYKPIVPNAKIVHDRLGIEVARGCTRGCRFCQAGITYRPVRERSISQILELAKKGIDNSGFEELALLSLSTGDYSCLPALLPKLMEQFSHEFVSVALPSMRVGTLTQELMDEIRKVRKTGFTLAPEAGSERLRMAINKGITEDDLIQSAADAFSCGWNMLKLYFMIGLPTETMDDVDAIVDLAKKTAAAGNVSGYGRKKVTVSVGTFVPKPHTPFQWAPQLTIAQSRERINRLKTRIPRKGFNFKWHDPEQSYLEGVFSRGDRRLAHLIVEAWRKGARLDSWSDHFQLKRWLECAETCSVKLDYYLRERDLDEILPWSHLGSGVDDEFLISELKKTQQGDYTPDCRYHGCQQCGLCDFDTISPVVHNELREIETLTERQSTPVATREEPEGKFRYLVSYSRTGTLCYLGHLEFLQIIFRSLRRAKIKTNFSQGYNPSPKVSFSPALPVGTESLCEYFVMELPSPIDDFKIMSENLTRVLPEGITINEIRSFSGKIPQGLETTYTIILKTPLSTTEQQHISQFLEKNTYCINRTRKGKEKQIDIRPLVALIKVKSPEEIEMKLITRSGQPAIKPLELLGTLCQPDRVDLLSSFICKTESISLDL